jgi:hypothetical protein
VIVLILGVLIWLIEVAIAIYTAATWSPFFGVVALAISCLGVPIFRRLSWSWGAALLAAAVASYIGTVAILIAIFAIYQAATR